MMCTLVLVFCFNLFQLTESRVCWGVSGEVCCDGFMLNQSTGICQKCPIGFYNDNCSEKCSPPNYGEDCQSVCQCPDIDCHFGYGCLQETGTFTKHWQLKITDRLSTSVTSLALNVTNSYHTVDQDISLDVNKHEDSTLTYLRKDIDLFKNSFVINLVQVIVSLVGVFVFFFAACVVTYIYAKCFRQTTDGKRLNITQYEFKSRSFEALGYESQLPPEPEQQANLELTYLTPVFRNDVKSETNLLTESDIIVELPMHNRQMSSQHTNISKMTSETLQDHVYIEVLGDNFESSRVHECPDIGNIHCI
nr:uncharacterized protein LOC105332632 [Crassostrea gigas]